MSPEVEKLVERPPVEHELKTWPEPYAAVKSGAKPFEYRRNDRDYRLGDTLLLREWTPSWPPGEGSYTGDEIRRAITFVLPASMFGVPKGFCVLGLADQSQARRVEELEGALEEARTQLRDALAVRNAALNAEATAEADAIRYRYLREHRSSHYPMTWEQPAEWSIQWEFQQCTPDERFGAIDAWIDRDIAELDEEDRSALVHPPSGVTAPDGEVGGSSCTESGSTASPKSDSACQSEGGA